MPISLSYPEKEVIAAIFIDDPRAVLDFLFQLAAEQAKSEAEFAQTWKKVSRALGKAGDDATPLYKR